MNNSVLNRFSAIDLSESTAKSRLVLWKIALESFAERPILGWGQGNFIIPYAANYDSKLYGNELWFDRTHNTLLQWLVDAGVIGLAGYLLIAAAVLSVLNKIRKKNVWSENQVIVFWAFAAGYFIQSFFVFDALVSYFLLAAILGFLVYESGTGENEKRLLAGNKWFFSSKIIVNCALIIFIFAAIVILGIVVNYKAINQGKLLLKSLSAIESKNEPDLFKSAVAGFADAFSVSSFGLEETRMQSAVFILDAVKYKNKFVFEDKNFSLLLDMAIGEMEKETRADNFNLRPLISLAKLYEVKFILNQNQESFNLVESTFRDAFRFKNYLPFYFYFAEYRINIGDNGGAAFIAKNILEKFGDSPKILQDVMEIYAMSGYHDEVWKIIHKNTIFNQWPLATDFLRFGRMAMKQGNVVEALRYGDNALKLAKDNKLKKEIFLFLYEIEKVSGNREKAEFYMREANSAGL